MSSSTVNSIGLILPLGLDTFAVALTLGIVGLPARRRLQLALLFAGFEAGMPLIGVALGAPLGRAIGSNVDFAAAGLIAALGLYMLFVESDGEDSAERARVMTQRGRWGLIALGLSVSLDELAIGFSAGLLHLPVVEIIVAIALQAFVATQLGVWLGQRAGARLGEAAERLAGTSLVALAVILLIERLVA